MKGAGGQNSGDSPISVFVRIRPPACSGRSADETQVVRSSSKSQVCVQSSNQTQKTFTYDRVFGPEANQEQIFVNTTKPVLDEVLNGYSCTIFAYGQTGTGKTYTMSGDFSSPEKSGIIPRSIKQLFNRLQDENIVEFVVKISFVELYNEELYDLLALEENSTAKLKIYDDKDGAVKIQGLEEKNVTNYDEALQVFDQGTKKRKIAETKMNLESSRSHSVFICNIYMKETSIDNSEIVKLGKLNLVDLAGSENISKSGATDKRRREAGSINTSLLTLGRVITALDSVSGSQHVPYRESKLTRLLKDSLGGKTKTTMIATVSTQIGCLDETLSTLEYALRSKNIKNKPEINQKVTQKGLIKDMSEEMERMRRELRAAHSKNGVYMDQENYNNMTKTIEILTEKNDELENTIKQMQEENTGLNDQMATINTLLGYYEPATFEYYDNECNSYSQYQALVKKCDSISLKLKQAKDDAHSNNHLAREMQSNNSKLLPKINSVSETVEQTIKKHLIEQERIAKKNIEGHKEFCNSIQVKLAAEAEPLREKGVFFGQKHSEHFERLLKFFDEELRVNEQIHGSLTSANKSLESDVTEVQHKITNLLDNNFQSDSKYINSLASICSGYMSNNNHTQDIKAQFISNIADNESIVKDPLISKLKFLNEQSEHAKSKLAEFTKMASDFQKYFESVSQTNEKLIKNFSNGWETMKMQVKGCGDALDKVTNDNCQLIAKAQSTMNQMKDSSQNFCLESKKIMESETKKAIKDHGRRTKDNVLCYIEGSNQEARSERSLNYAYMNALSGELKTFFERDLDNMVKESLELILSEPQAAEKENKELISKCNSLKSTLSKLFKEKLATFEKLMACQKKFDNGYLFCEVDSLATTIEELPAPKEPIPRERLLSSDDKNLNNTSNKKMSTTEKSNDECIENPKKRIKF